MTRPHWLVSLVLLTFPSAKAHPESSNCSAGVLPVVTDVYPSSNQLPENILRFYIYFSSPMDEATVSSAVSLNDMAGDEVEGVFLHISNALWSPDKTRLTLIMDPGRVKTGLVASEKYGSAIKSGKRYILTVGTEARDIFGCPLEAKFSKPFEVSGRDETTPNPLLWSIAAPNSGSVDWLKIEMNEMIDHVSLAYRIRVFSSSGDTILGKIDLGFEEREWYFTPSQPWSEEEYTIKIDPVLEDVSGNRMMGLFDQPLGRSSEKQPEQVHIRFQALSEADLDE